jgi:hypothetical protein
LPDARAQAVPTPAGLFPEACFLLISTVANADSPPCLLLGFKVLEHCCYLESNGAGESSRNGLVLVRTCCRQALPCSWEAWIPPEPSH